MKTLWIPLPFTLLDKFLVEPCSPTDVLSNVVNPFPPKGGESFGRICLINYGLVSKNVFASVKVILAPAVHFLSLI